MIGTLCRLCFISASILRLKVCDTESAVLEHSLERLQEMEIYHRQPELPRDTINQFSEVEVLALASKPVLYRLQYVYERDMLTELTDSSCCYSFHLLSRLTYGNQK
jgi:hypothetical protein